VPRGALDRGDAVAGGAETQESAGVAELDDVDPLDDQAPTDLG